MGRKSKKKSVQRASEEPPAWRNKREDIQAPGVLNNGETTHISRSQRSGRYIAYDKSPQIEVVALTQPSN